MFSVIRFGSESVANPIKTAQQQNCMISLKVPINIDRLLIDHRPTQAGLMKRNTRTFTATLLLNVTPIILFMNAQADGIQGKYRWRPLDI